MTKPIHSHQLTRLFEDFRRELVAATLMVVRANWEKKPLKPHIMMSAVSTHEPGVTWALVCVFGALVDGDAVAMRVPLRPAPHTMAEFEDRMVEASDRFDAIIRAKALQQLNDAVERAFAEQTP